MIGAPPQLISTPADVVSWHGHRAGNPSIGVRRELDPGASAATAAFVTQQVTQEARVIASLEHPNILPIFEFGEQEHVSDPH